jgi:hypothetical protein
MPGLCDLTYLVTLVLEYIVKWLLLWYPAVLTCCYELNMLGSSGTSWSLYMGVLRFGLIFTMLLNYFRLIIVVVAICDLEPFGLNRYLFVTFGFLESFDSCELTLFCCCF